MSPASNPDPHRLSVRQIAVLASLVQALLVVRRKPPQPQPSSGVSRGSSGSNSSSSSSSSSSSGNSSGCTEEPCENDMMKNAGSDDDCDDLSRNKSFMEALCVAIAEKLSSADRTAMSALLSLLSTAAGTTLLFLGSNWNCWTTTITQMSFDAWPLPRRTRALAQWQRSSLVLHRQAFSGLKRLIGALAFSFVPNEEEATAAVVAANHSTTTNTNNTNISTKNNTNYNNTGSSSKTNPFWEGMGFPGSPTTWQALDPDQVAAADRRQAPLVQALRSSRQELLDHHHQQQQQDQHPQSENTNTNPKNTNNTTGGDWDCDVILVGSGAGASVAALVLARAGWKVWILEKSVYKLPSTISLVESTALDEQYEQHGLLTTSNNGGVVSILAGSAVGGGTAINWSCCLPLPKYVRHEWARVYGLEAFRVKHDTPPLEPSSSSSAKSSKSATANDADATAGAKDKYELDNNNSDEYDTSLAFILNILGATEKDKRKIVHNAMNRKLQEGCDALGYPWEVTGQNLRDPGDVTAGFIGMGDRYGNKNGGVQAFLIEAVHEHGARIVQNCRVDRILHTTDTTTTASSSAHSLKGRRRATGVECTLTDTGVQMTIRARHAVIVAAGALRTPGLLTKSGLRNPHIGRHLRLHPVTGVLGFTSPKKDPIDPVLGAPMTTVCNEFVQGPHRDGYGVKIETPCAYPGLLAAASPWLSVQVYKDRLFRYRNCVPLVLVQRDSGDGGRVKMARNGTEVLVDYTMNERDKQSLMMAMQGAAKILVSSQSVEVATGHVYDDGFQTGEKPANEELLNEYLDSILSRGMKDHEIGLFSAHQMGSCRMTASPKTGAVDSNGETWECDDLYVMDASLFPTASGSNPMVTVMTIAHMLSTRLNLLLQLRVQTSSNSTHSTDATHSVSTRRSDIFATDEKCLRRALALSKQREAVRSLHGKSCGGWSTLWSWLKSNSPTMALLPLLIAIPLAWGLGFRPLRTEFLIP